MFIRREKRQNNLLYFWLVKSHRVNGKPRQQKIAYLGIHMTIGEAIECFHDEALMLRQEARRRREWADTLWRDTEYYRFNVEWRQQAVLIARRYAQRRDKEAQKKEQQVRKLKALLQLYPYLEEVVPKHIR